MAQKSRFIPQEARDGAEYLTSLWMTVCGGVCALRRGERRARIGRRQGRTDLVSGGEFAPQGERNYGVRESEGVEVDPLPRYLRKNVILKGMERVLVQGCDSKGVFHAGAGVLWVGGVCGEGEWNGEFGRLGVDSRRFKSRKLN